MAWVRIGQELPVENDNGERPEFDDEGIAEVQKTVEVVKPSKNEEDEKSHG